MSNESTRLDEVVEQTGCCRLVPISHLSLDLDEPVVGWDQYLLAEGIDVQTDDCGRPSIARSVFGVMVREQASMQKLWAEQAALRAAELAAAERRTPLSAGVPAIDGLSTMETVMAAPDYQSPRDEFGNPRVNWIAEQLEGDARRSAAEANQKQRLTDQMRDDLSGKGNQ